MMGDTGPCGPCTEIFFDHGDKVKGGPPGSPDQDGDRYVEFWNNVFMQFEQQPNGPRVKMAKQSIDTGMGLERMATILQGKHDIFEIDSLRALSDATRARDQYRPERPAKKHRCASSPIT